MSDAEILIKPYPFAEELPEDGQPECDTQNYILDVYLTTLEKFYK
ncbi:hypothetical protein [Granulicella sp. S156]|nr:hypothetical protein [Granulicella sp. S156]